MSRLEEIKDKYAKTKQFDNWTDFINDESHWMVEKHMDKVCEIYAKECSQASLEKAKKDLYNYWIFFEEGKTNSPEFTIKVEDPAKVYNTAYEAYGPQVEDLFYSCVSHEESITNPENIVLL
ncbi:hypothetical protein DRF62_02140 [Chryseobacterium piscium]|uniref:Uncharacterized protein n=1 Tax=Chryseobacterium piscium TaxID=333702 RepID=A0A3D9BTX9_9FLAO|nr:hypothetical protein [Chryseobacterium piscium]REC56980.1 hypothetical protein DRF62_02140 [Chryseobacterium piscium]